MGIYHTNALPCGFTGPDADAGERADKGGLFILGSRFNSSCRPNVNNHWDSDLQQIVFRSVRDIEKGEELCISYGNYLARRDLRREELKRNFGFDCMCEVCSLEGAELEESERRKEHICEIWDQLPNPDPVVGIRQVCQVFISYLRGALPSFIIIL